MKRMLVLGWMLLALAGLAARSGATTCGGCRGSFLENAPKADLVIRGTAVELVGQWGNGVPRYAKIRVQEVFKGEPPADFVVIEGDDGMSLRPYASTFQPSTDWLLALRLSHTLEKDGKKAWIYTVSSCGSYALKIEKETVTSLSSCPEPDYGKPLADFTRRLTEAIPSP